MADSPMSQRAFAERIGKNPKTVNDVLRAGKVTAGVVRDPKTGVLKIIDAFAAEKQWREVMDPTRIPPGPAQDVAMVKAAALADDDPDEASSESRADAALRKMHWQAQSAELDYRERARELIPAAEVERGLAEEYAAVRTHLLAIPSRARQEDPSFTVAQVELIDRLVREALTELGGQHDEEPEEPEPFESAP